MAKLERWRQGTNRDRTVFLFARVDNISSLKFHADPLRRPDNVRPLCWLYEDIDSAFRKRRALA